MSCNGAVAALGSNCLSSGCTPNDLFANSQGPSASCLNAGAPPPPRAAPDTHTLTHTLRPPGDTAWMVRAATAAVKPNALPCSPPSALARPSAAPPSLCVACPCSLATLRALRTQARGAPPGLRCPSQLWSPRRPRPLRPPRLRGQHTPVTPLTRLTRAGHPWLCVSTPADQHGDCADDDHPGCVAQTPQRRAQGAAHRVRAPSSRGSRPAACPGSASLARGATATA